VGPRNWWEIGKIDQSKKRGKEKYECLLDLKGDKRS